MAQRNTSTSYEKSQMRDLLIFLLDKYDVRCCFCGKRVTKEDIPVRGSPLVTVHHVNQVHEDDRIENRAVAHRRCHKSVTMAFKRFIGEI